MKGFYKYFQSLFFFVVFVIFFSLIVAITPLSGLFVFYIFSLMGQILLNTFSFLAFYLVLYPLINFYAYKNKCLSTRFIFNFNYTIILFFTLTFFVKVNIIEENSNFINSFLLSFGYILGNLFILSVLILEIIVWGYLNFILFKNTEFLIDFFEFVKFKFLTLIEVLLSYISIGKNRSLQKDIKVYDKDQEPPVSSEVNIGSSIVSDEEMQALWSFNRIARDDSSNSNVNLEKTIFKESEPKEDCDTSSINMIEQIKSEDAPTHEYKNLENSRLVIGQKTKVSELRDKSAFSQISRETKNNVEVENSYKDKNNLYNVNILVFDKKEPKSELEDIEYEKEIQKQSMILQETFREFGISAKLIEVIKGPVVTMYAVRPDKGIKLSRITSISDNIALRLAAARVRIIAPIPGKEAVGIEIPNKKREFIFISEIIDSEEFKREEYKIPFALGKEISGDNIIIDLANAPHLLIAGATGAGKSVCVNSLIASIIYAKSPDEVKLIMIDPKIVELKLFNNIPHLLTPVITDVSKALEALRWCVDEMERRYVLLDNLLVRDINSYNKKIFEDNLNYAKLPYLVLIIDEFADLILSSRKDLENLISRLAAMARAVGIHLVLATQRPSVDVITGVIKANFPSRISFMVASTMDSRIILGTSGAEKLLGRGDMLYVNPTTQFPQRIQGGFLKEKEIYRLVEEVKKFGEPNYIDDEIFIESAGNDVKIVLDPSDEPMFDEALEIVRTTRKASASYLQRRLKIGYNRAARIIELMEEMGYIGPANGSKARDVFI